MSWLDKLFRREGDVVGESAGGVGVWATGDEHRANKQQSDPAPAEVEDDPRGGLHDSSAPIDESTPDERLSEQRS